MTLPSHEIATSDVLDLAAQLSNGGSQSPQQEPEQEQRIPYDRFKEVNEERKDLAEQNRKLMELVSNFQNMQTSQPQPQTPAQPQVAPSLFTDDELNSFEQDIVLDPKSTLQRFGDAILKRGVDTKVSALEKSFEEKFAQFQTSFATAQAPTIVDNFVRQRFGANDTAEVNTFRQALQGMDPTTLSNPATLENVRLAAIGYVADQRRTNPQFAQQNPQIFSETPGGGNGGFGGLLGQSQQVQVPPQVAILAQKMGLDPKEANSLYTAMQQKNVFRDSI